MALGIFKLPAWGPKKLQERDNLIVDRLNRQTPLAGCGVRATEEPSGIMLEIDIPAVAESVATAQSSSGTNVNIYGALNGQPALFHLVQTADPTPV